MKPAAKLIAIGAIAAAFPLTAQEPAADKTADNAQSEPKPDLVGDYNGNSFETASGLRLSADGTFEWFIAVGALDMRASGTWEQNGTAVAFTSDPKPVPPTFTWAGFDQTPDAPFLRIINAGSGKPFDYASVKIVCANGAMFQEQAQLGIWSPSSDDNCDTPEKVRLKFSVYQVESRAFDLNGPMKPKPGQTIVFHFNRNDMGVADFTGVTGQMSGGELTVSGGLGEQTFRKITPKPAQD